MEEEIVTGLRNAVERGQPIEKAINSYINAGYPSKEVNDAARQVKLGVTPQIKQPAVQVSEAGAEEAKLKLPKFKKKPSLKIIILIVVLILLFGALAIAFFFGEEILGLLFG